jgi:hypothetical protein
MATQPPRFLRESVPHPFHLAIESPWIGSCFRSVRRYERCAFRGSN